jgi:hypothetical protein
MVVALLLWPIFPIRKAARVFVIGLIAASTTGKIARERDSVGPE